MLFALERNFDPFLSSQLARTIAIHPLLKLARLRLVPNKLWDFSIESEKREATFDTEIPTVPGAEIQISLGYGNTHP